MSTTDPARALRQLVEARRSGPDRLGLAMLELALALIESAEVRGETPAQAGEVSEELENWAGDCAAVLAAVARPLSVRRGLARGGPVPAHADALPAVASRLAARTRTAREELTRVTDRLRGESAELVRRAGQFGALTRTLQLERVRLADDLRAVDSLEAELSRVKSERGGIVERVGALHERLRLALAAPEQIRDLNNEVVDAEASARRQRPELEALQERLAALREELAALPEAVARTRSLIEALESSPEGETARGIREIWSRLPRDPMGERG